MADDDRLHNGQAQAGSRHRPRLNGTVETLEDLVSIFLRDTWPRVRYRELSEDLAERRQTNPHGAIFWRPLCSIVHQVQNCATKTRRIPVDIPRSCLHIESNIRTTTLNTRQRRGNDFVDIDMLNNLLRSIFACQINQVTDQRRQLFQLCDDVSFQIRAILIRDCRSRTGGHHQQFNICA